MRKISIMLSVNRTQKKHRKKGGSKMTTYYTIFIMALAIFTLGYCWGAYQQRKIKRGKKR